MLFMECDMRQQCQFIETVGSTYGSSLATIGAAVGRE